jgi:hypothetical protein
MLYSEIIAVCSEIHTKHINTLCGQNVELLNVKPGGTYSNHWDIKDYLKRTTVWRETTTTMKNLEEWIRMKTE